MTSRRFLDLVARSADQWVGAILSPNRRLDPDTILFSPAFTAKILKLAGDNGGKAHFARDFRIVLYLRKDSNGGIGRLDDMVRRACHETPIAAGQKDTAGKPPLMIPMFYDLGAQLAEFTEIIEHLENSSPSGADPLVARATRQTARTLKFTSHMLGQLEAALPQLDIAALFRDQWVCALMPGRPPTRIYRELFVSIDGLANLAAPLVDLQSDRRLFQVLLSHLDPLALGAMISTARLASTDLGLNLTCQTVLTPLFRQVVIIFANSHRELIVEFQAHELLADTAGFIAAVRAVKDTGHKVCLDGLTDAGAAMLRLDSIDVDFIKIVAPRPGLSAPEITEAIAAKLGKLEPTRVILSRCEQAHQVSGGQAAGGVLFQGWYTDSTVTPAKTPAELAVA